MPYRAIIFDLYGTLVDNFSRRAYDKVQEEMAKILGVPYPKFWQAMGETIKDRSLGNLSAEENIVEVCRRLGAKADRTQIEQTVFLQDEFTRNSIILKFEVSEALNLLKLNGLHIGLITNCNAAVPRFFPESPLAQYIDAPVFSCEERVKKPSRRIYKIAYERLKVKPQECLYVGDGSGEELKGAAAAGMLPILKRADLTDVYDPHRPEVENWQGIAIDEISELCAIVSKLA
ncbi:HAD-IA family hydrolase [Candidatus Poribacteria bacterium]|nr:HAD-IA family hydrolase [Candidatus Poribacteria bacterium]MYK19127.1 HAD-IA family hydrolase [Candidatus Poribacteria bacterium]